MMNKKNHISKPILILLALMCIMRPALSQEKDKDYISQYNAGEYQKALNTIEAQLKEIYGKRVEGKRVPTGFITMKNTDREIDLMKVYRKRRAKGFFIEENEEIALRHLYAARCHVKLKSFSYAARHYYQCLRFRKLSYKRDDIVFYELSQLFKELGMFEGYLDALETAYTLNQENYSYSLELGTALYATAHKKKSILHLERYLQHTEDAVDPRLYLMAGNLYEDIARYLETERNYIKYLEAKPDDGYTHFALGFICYKRTGNYELARGSFKKALQQLPEKEILRRSRAYEYLGDMDYRDLELDDALVSYRESIKYQQQVKSSMDAIQEEIAKMNEKLNELKASLIKKSDFDEYEAYEFLKDEKSQRELDLLEMQKEYKKLNSGKVRWNLAEILEKKEDYEQAIGYYREVISYDYRASLARDRIVKLKLKIKRGY